MYYVFTKIGQISFIVYIILWILKFNKSSKCGQVTKKLNFTA